MDDLEAVRKIVEILSELEKEDQSRVVRWSLEKLNLDQALISKKPVEAAGGGARDTDEGKRQMDIKTFILSKNPSSDNQFAATVAYYYAFEAPADEKKNSVNGTDLIEACRKGGRPRLGDPAKTLANATSMGYLDKVDRGFYKLNTVGENLVAMTLPSNSGESSSRLVKAGIRKRATATKKGNVRKAGRAGVKSKHRTR